MDMVGDGSGTTIHIEVQRKGRLVGSRLASVAPCREDALFEGILSGRVPNDGTLPPLTVAPTWSGEPDPSPAPGAAPAPEVTGSKITGVELRLGDGPPRRYGRDVFAAQARALIASLVAEGKLAEGEIVNWGLVERPDDRPAPRFAVRVARQPLPLSPARLPEVAPGEVRAEMTAALLDQLRREFREAGAVERAWLLIGSVDHDPARGAAAVRAVAAVGVETGRGGASRSHFAFEPSAFVAARERARRDLDGLETIGWAHTHPPCEACPANPTCKTDTRFFSADDVEVHTSAFASPYMIALVAGKAATAPATEPGFHLYGWRDALVSRIEYRVAGLEH
jgi:proteasome lid subunit RPN8/RPN11